jgi:hypothetical protein
MMISEEMMTSAESARSADSEVPCGRMLRSHATAVWIQTLVNSNTVPVETSQRLQ